MLLRLLLDIHDLVRLVHALHQSLPVGDLTCADAGAQSELRITIRIGFFDRTTETTDELADTCGTVQYEDSFKFISAHTGSDLVFIKDRFKTTCDSFEGFITGGMSEIVVNIFKTIHIDTRDSDRVFFELAFVKKLRDFLLEAAAVQKSRKRVPDIQILDVAYLEKLVIEP